MTKTSTLLSSEAELFNRLEAEGVTWDGVSVISPRWAETAPRREGAKSALAKCDLLVRSDGSAVGLDGAMAIDSMIAADVHTGHDNASAWRAFERVFPEFANDRRPMRELIEAVRAQLGWDAYVERLKKI